MLTQLAQATSVESALSFPFTHLVTLFNRRTGDEAVLEVRTQTDRFADVYQQICWMKAEAGLKGYEIWEVLPSDNSVPF
jgi:hypothetical protein